RQLSSSDPAPFFGSIGFYSRHKCRFTLAYRPELRLRSTRTQKGRALLQSFIPADEVRQGENGGSCCLFRRIRPSPRKNAALLQHCHKIRVRNGMTTAHVEVPPAKSGRFPQAATWELGRRFFPVGGEPLV